MNNKILSWVFIVVIILLMVFLAICVGKFLVGGMFGYMNLSLLGYFLFSTLLAFLLNRRFGRTETNTRTTGAYDARL